MCTNPATSGKNGRVGIKPITGIPASASPCRAGHQHLYIRVGRQSPLPEPHHRAFLVVGPARVGDRHVHAHHDRTPGGAPSQRRRAIRRRVLCAHVGLPESDVDCSNAIDRRFSGPTAGSAPTSDSRCSSGSDGGSQWRYRFHHQRPRLPPGQCFRDPGPRIPALIISETAAAAPCPM